jgi:nucleotide-binding universal stress UspA family protein
MLARALFPTDFSAYADAVLACLPDLKGIGLQEVVLLSVIRPSDVPLPETLNRQSLAYWQWYLGEKMNIARMALEGKGLRAYSRIEYGNVVETILRVAEEERVEWLILGAQGATAAQEILLGTQHTRFCAAPVYRFCCLNSRSFENLVTCVVSRFVSIYSSESCIPPTSLSVLLQLFRWSSG